MRVIHIVMHNVHNYVWTTVYNSKIIKKGNKMKTIVALCTPAGVGAIAVIRLSGDKAWSIVKELITDNSGKKIENLEPRKMTLCNINIKKIKDKVMVVHFCAPNSYTGEEVVEIQLHGNNILSQIIISEAIKKGAFMAEGGEFTRRAMLNNKLDLSEAEGIISVINATAESELRAAAESSDGELYKIINDIFNKLIELGAKAESVIDYPEEDLEEITENEISEELKIINVSLSKLIDGFDNGKVLREGALIVIAGEANVGKSTLLNKIIGYDRAIVSDEAGTTRDTLTESYIYKGIKFNICDTAGIRTTSNKIEALGIERSNKQIECADIIIALTEIGKTFDIPLPKNKKIIYAQNKADNLTTTTNGEGVIYCKNKHDIKSENIIDNPSSGSTIILLSALMDKNVDKLKEMIYTIVMTGVSSDGVGLNNSRQQAACIECKQSVTRAIENIGKITVDCIASDIKVAAVALGKITGKTASAEIIAEIFKKFCVGK